MADLSLAASSERLQRLHRMDDSASFLDAMWYSVAKLISFYINAMSTLCCLLMHSDCLDISLNPTLIGRQSSSEVSMSGHAPTTERFPLIDLSLAVDT